MDENIKDMLDGAGFGIVEEVELGDLSDIKEERTILPPSKDVLFSIRKVTNMPNKDNTYRQLNISLSIVDGINGQFKNMVVWARVCYYADPKKYVDNAKTDKARTFFSKRNHLLELTKFLTAVGIDVRSAKINDALFTELQGKKLLGTITQKTSRYTNKEGIEVEEIRNEVRNFKKAGDSALV